MSDSVNKRRNIIFVHGSGGNRAAWPFQARYFSQHHNVLAVDLPGHGPGVARRPSTLREFVDFIDSLIREKPLAEPILVGHSLGGAIVLRLALDNPAAIGGLVLVGTGARLRVTPALIEALKTDFEAALATIGACSFSPQAPEKMVEKALVEMRKSGPELLLGDFAACDGFDVIDELPRLSLPTLIVVGRDDRLTPVKYSEYLNRAIAGSQLEIIDGAGHMVMLEKPDAFNAAVDRFLRNLR
ncbi:MAG: alpha/beta hydrolase [Chloroflexi bacterium]|nr:alpha/beta hydrolase [Chloroflexota bacterium]